MSSLDPGFHALNTYVGGLRVRAAATADIAKRRCTRRLVRVLGKIAAGEPVVVSGETIISDVPREIPGVVPDFWYRLCADGTIERLRPYLGKRDTPPEIE